MNKYSFTNNGKTWERITKKQARAAYNNGLTVVFCPVNMRPFTPWHLEIDVNKNFEGYNGVSFEKAVNAFEIYTRICSPNTAGKQAINVFACCKGGYIMRKVSATVIYKDNTLYNLTVNHKGVLIPLVAYDEISVKHPYEKRTFQTMYKSVLNILKNNNFYCGYYEQFGRRWYDIQFINLENPVNIEKFGMEV